MNPLFPPSSNSQRRAPRDRTQPVAYGLYVIDHPHSQVHSQPAPLSEPEPDPFLDPDLDLDTELSNLSCFIGLLLEHRAQTEELKTGVAILIGFCYSISNIADILDSRGIPFDVGPLIRDLVYSSIASGKLPGKSDDPLL